MSWAAFGAAASSAAQIGINMKEASKNRKWQEYMSNTAYQRGVKDLKAAGLNPMLAYTQGGATTPVGSTARADSSPVGDAVNSGLAVKLNKATIDNLEEQNKNIRADTSKKHSEDIESQARTQNTYADVTNKQIESGILLEQNKVMQEEAILRNAATAKAVNDAKFAKTWFGRNISPALRDLNSALDAARSGKDLFTRKGVRR